MRKVMVTAALTGGLYSKESNPNLPEQPDEIIAQALQCREVGSARGNKDADSYLC
jgi:3-keto-5-aminohexanoate cleavage enzyme